MPCGGCRLPTGRTTAISFTPLRGSRTGTFFADCAVWSAFAPSNNTCSMKDVAYRGEIFRVRNQLFPYSQLEANGWSGREIADPEEGNPSCFRG